MKKSEQNGNKETDVLQETEEKKLRWYGHIPQMEACRIATQVAEWNPQGKRSCGRPVNTWNDGIRDHEKQKPHG
jgi:hypothetical protein